MPSQTVARYQVVVRQNAADIHLYSSTGLAGSIYFKPDGTPLQSALQESSGRVVLQYPLSQLSSVIDILRNEAPVYIWYSSPSLAYIATLQEAVGEQELHP